MRSAGASTQGGFVRAMLRRRLPTGLYGPAAGFA
jgi:hypothetical protein